MSAKKYEKRIMSRRQFVQSSATAAVGLLLAACAGNAPAEEVAPVQTAQSSELTAATPEPPTATPAMADTAQPGAAAAAPADSPTPEPTLAPAGPPTLEPTPQCDDHDETPAQTEGPFYTPDTPERASLLEEGIEGTILVVSGQVLTPNCEPIAGAVLDFWHADDSGQYDNVGYRLRGHQFTDENGRYHLETIMPGVYPGRTRHIHVKVQGPNTSLLTTQMYFPDEPGNQTDGIFNPALVMAVSDSAGGKAAAFDFVLA